MKTIIETSVNLLKSAEIASAAGISPSSSWRNYHVFLVPYREEFDFGMNIGRLPFVKISAVSQTYAHEASPDFGNVRTSCWRL